MRASWVVTRVAPVWSARACQIRASLTIPPVWDAAARRPWPLRPPTSSTTGSGHADSAEKRARPSRGSSRYSPTTEVEGSAESHPSSSAGVTSVAFPRVATLLNASPRRSPTLITSPASPPLCEISATLPAGPTPPPTNVCRPRGQ